MDNVLLLDIGAGDLPPVTPVSAPEGSWFPQPYQAPAVPAPTGVDTDAVADGVLITWDAVNLPNVIYVIERAPDVAGEPGTWVEVARTTETRYTYTQGTGGLAHYRVRAESRGVPSDPSDSHAQVPVSVAELVDVGAALDAEVAARIAGDATEAGLRAAALAAEAAARAADIATEAAARNAAILSAVDAEAALRGAAISAEQAARSAADSALASSITALQANGSFQAFQAWEFDAGPDSWAGIGASLVLASGIATLTASTERHSIARAALTVTGGEYSRVRARIRRVAGTWAGWLLYSTGSHAVSDGYHKAVAKPAGWDEGKWCVVEWDMAELTSGGNDWLTSIITGLRLEIAGGADAVTEVDWIAVGKIGAGLSSTAWSALETRVTNTESTNTAQSSSITQLGNDLSAANAAIATKAAASALSALDTRVTATEGQVASQGTSITSLTNTINHPVSGLATRASSAALTALDSRVTAAEGSLTSQSSAITALRSTLGGGGNILVGSGFEDGLGGWLQGVNNTGLTIGTPQANNIIGQANNGSLVGDANRYIPNNSRSILLNLAGTPSASSYLEYYSPQIPVVANKKYMLSMWINNFRCNARIYIVFFAENNGVLGQHTITQSASSDSAPTFTTLTRRKVEGVAGSTAVYARVYVQIVSTSEVNPYAWFIRPMLEEVPADKTEPSPWVAPSAGLDQKYATATQSLSTRMTTAEGNITATANAVTNVRAELTGGGNMLPNAGMEYDAASWTVQDAQGGWGGYSFGRNLAGDTWRPIGMCNIAMSGGGTPSASQVAIIRSDFVPVTQLKRYIFSAYLAAHRATAYLQIIWLDASASSVVGITSSTNGNISTVINNGGQNLNNWSRCFTDNVQAPAGAFLAYCRVVAVGAGSANPYIWMVRPMFEEVGPQQTMPSKWSEATAGMNTRYATVTQSLDVRAATLEAGQAVLNAQYVLAVDVNGRVGGMRLANNGATVSLEFLADVFKLVNPSGADSLTWENGVMVARSGGYMKVTGKGFGVGGNLIDWYGPVMAVSACSTANSIYHMTRTGSAYFGGTLSAGLLRNAVTATSTAVDAQCVNGPFGTNGNPKTVVVSYSFTKNDIANTGTWTSTSGTVAATIQVYRKVGAGAESLVTTLNVTGTYEVANEPGGPSGLTSRMNGSTTFVDNTAGTGDFTYRAVITARTFRTGTASSGTISVQTSQAITIVSTEQ